MLKNFTKLKTQKETMDCFTTSLYYQMKDAAL